ncbi:arginase family protein [Catellatospora sp. KI3]|uniref:arginase family protein n=1 Tax=Catellatospora sp. KI3 TaxID=3041620 RepID=UPI002482EA6A|nr:arginase family protein [Catellatospora sp. KI3]MDI1461398.1 arginase family protein [Catellatospora sp. KI3]
MTIIAIPYHQDEQLDPADLPIAADTTVEARFAPGADRWQRLVQVHDTVAAAVAGSPVPPTVVSGDCLVAIGVTAGLQRAGLDPGVVWFDAHGDVHTMASSTSGYLGGMALRWLVGGDPELVTGPLGLRPLAEDRAVLVDARDLDPAEHDYLRTAAVTHRQVAGLDAADLPTGPLLLHVDVDVIDSAEVPGLRFPVPGGPDGGTVLAALRRVLATGRVAALHLACPWRPTTDADRAARTELLARLTSLG